MKRILVLVPKSTGGSAGIAERVDVEQSQAFGRFDLLHEGSGCIRIIDIVALPESSHLQMILDDESNQLSVFFADLHALEDRFGKNDAILGMSFDRVSFANVVKKEDQIEKVGQTKLVYLLPIAIENGVRTREDIVEFPNCMKRVDIGSIAMIVLVLHEAS